MTQLHGGVAERSCVRLQKNWQQRSQRIYRGSNPLPTSQQMSKKFSCNLKWVDHVDSISTMIKLTAGLFEHYLDFGVNNNTLLVRRRAAQGRNSTTKSHQQTLQVLTQISCLA